MVSPGILDKQEPNTNIHDQFSLEYHSFARTSDISPIQFTYSYALSILSTFFTPSHELKLAINLIQEQEKGQLKDEDQFRS